jgi:hypothetical protein
MFALRGHYFCSHQVSSETNLMECNLRSEPSNTAAVVEHALIA